MPLSPAVPFRLLAPFARAGLAAALLGSTALPAAASEIRAVTLSTAGIAMVEATGAMGPEPLRLTLRRADIDDFLKSAWIADPAGAVPQLTLPGAAAFEDLFALLPLAPEDVTDPARLLRALVGAEVTVTRRGATVTGQNMGVSARDCEAGSCQILTLLTADGTLAQFDLAESVVGLAEQEDRDMLARALAAHRGAAGPGLVEVAITSDDPAARSVDLVYLQRAPLWRTAYRAVAADGGLRLSGWAVVENTTGQDWEGVELTLATGSVRALAADLYERRYVARESAAGAPPPPMAAPVAAARTGGVFGFADAMPMAEAAPAPVMVEADDGVSFSRFTLGVPVTLEAGQVMSLPFLDERLDGAQRLVYRGGQWAEHPQIALEIRNPLPLRLPAGVLTLYEDGRGHAGDATIPELAPGAVEVIDFATDRAVTVRETFGRTETLRRVTVSQGLMVVEEDLQQTTSYRVEGAPDAERSLDIEHPRNHGWTVAEPAPTEERLDTILFRLTVPAGEIRTLEVVERQPSLRRMSLADLDAESVASWLRVVPDGDARRMLESIAEIRSEQTRIQREIGRVDDETRSLQLEQDRLVELIVALDDDSPANDRRRDRVDQIDAELEALRARRAGLESEAASQAVRLDSLLRS